MADPSASPTPLLERHRELGGRIVEYAGWQLPVRYASQLDEHRAVRERAGLFDLSHMGELAVSGPSAGAGLARALITDPGALAVGRAHYSMLCAPDGGVLDDLIVYRLGDERFMVVANAANTAVVVAELHARLAGLEAEIEDRSRATGLVAVQGPQSTSVLAPLTNGDLDALRYYATVSCEVAGAEALVARTGYTGEDGFEIFCDWDTTPMIWDALLQAGAESPPVPAGLAARDTLRLEAGMPLYGHELTSRTTPFEAGLGQVVRLDRPTDFVGRAALEPLADREPERALVGLRVDGPGIAREGYAVLAAGGDAVGHVTSGTHSPTLGYAIAMAYAPASCASLDTSLDVDIRGRAVPAQIVPLPFYRRDA